MTDHIFFDLATIFSLPALAAYTTGWVRPGWSRVGRGILISSWAVMIPGFALRWAAAGWVHPPIVDWYESLTFSAWALMGLFLILERKFGLTPAGPGVVLVAVSALGLAAVQSNKAIHPLAPALRSWWLALHVTTAGVAYGAFAVAFGIAVLILLAGSDSKDGPSRVLESAAVVMIVFSGYQLGGPLSIIILLGLTLRILSRAPERGKIAFHLSSWWLLAAAMTQVPAKGGPITIIMLFVGGTASLLSLAASPLMRWAPAGRIGPWLAAIGIPAVAAADLVFFHPFPWTAAPLVILPVISLTARFFPAPGWTTYLLIALLITRMITGWNDGGSPAVGIALLLLILEAKMPVFIGPLKKKLPSRENLGESAYRAVLIGFPFMTLVIITGAAWARQAWGSYWGWDPKEVWSLVTWLVYALYLHARLLRKWRGEKAALLLILGFGVVVFTYIGVSTLMSGLHSYL